MKFPSHLYPWVFTVRIAVSTLESSNSHGGIKIANNHLKNLPRCGRFFSGRLPRRSAISVSIFFCRNRNAYAICWECSGRIGGCTALPNMHIVLFRLTGGRGMFFLFDGTPWHASPVWLDSMAYTSGLQQCIREQMAHGGTESLETHDQVIRLPGNEVYSLDHRMFSVNRLIASFVMGCVSC